MQRLTLPPLMGLLLGLCLTACPSTNPTPDAGTDAGIDASVPTDGGDGGDDAGADAGFSCTHDDDCAVFGQNQRCQTDPGPDQGQCIAGTLCNQDLECSSGELRKLLLGVRRRVPLRAGEGGGRLLGRVPPASAHLR